MPRFPVAGITKLSELSIDAALDMDGHNIALDAAQTVDGLDCSGVEAGADVTGSNTPQAHASTHEGGGADAIKVYDPDTSNTVVVTDPTNNTTGGTSYTTILDKTLSLPAGVIKLGIKYTYYKNSGAGTSYVRVYRGGVAVGTERTVVLADGDKTYSQVISGWSDGDHLIVKGYSASGQSVGAKDLTLYGEAELLAMPDWT